MMAVKSETMKQHVPPTSALVLRCRRNSTADCRTNRTTDGGAAQPGTNPVARLLSSGRYARRGERRKQCEQKNKSSCFHKCIEVTFRLAGHHRRFRAFLRAPHHVRPIKVVEALS